MRKQESSLVKINNFVYTEMPDLVNVYTYLFTLNYLVNICSTTMLFVVCSLSMFQRPTFSLCIINTFLLSSFINLIWVYPCGRIPMMIIDRYNCTNYIPFMELNTKTLHYFAKLSSLSDVDFTSLKGRGWEIQYSDILTVILVKGLSIQQKDEWHSWWSIIEWH